MELYTLLPHINSPEDIKSLDKKQIAELAQEIRKHIIDVVGKNGGHLASNLGNVELTIALHKHFNLPEDKLLFESQFQSISSGGCISYIETPNMSHNIPAVIQMIQFMYKHIKYAEMNGKFDCCQECKFEGEILLDENNEWYCPNCGNRNHNTMNVIRRTCGYLGSNFWNEGRTDEIHDRVLHIDNKEVVFDEE